MTRTTRAALVFVAVVILALSASLPTSWIMADAVDALTGEVVYDQNNLGMPVNRRLADPHRYAPHQNNEFLKSFHSGSAGAPLVRAQSYALTDDPASARDVWLRSASSLASIPLSSKGRSTTPDPLRAVHLELVRVALRDAQTAARKSPLNAFYPMLEFIYGMNLGEISTARAALERVAACDHYDENLLGEIGLSQRAMEATYGYRGSRNDLVRTYSILLPHLTSLSRAARAYVDGLPLSDPSRRDMLKLGWLMAKDGDSLITALSGKRLAFDSMLPPPLGAKAPALTLVQAAVAFERAQAKSVPEKWLRSLDKIAYADADKPLDLDAAGPGRWPVLLAPTALLGTLLTAGLALMAFWTRNVERHPLRPAVLLLLGTAFVAYVAMVERFDASFAALMIAVLAGASGVASYFPKGRGVADVLLWLAWAGSLAALPVNHFLFGGAALFPLVRWTGWSARPFWGALVWTLLAFGVATFWVLLRLGSADFNLLLRYVLAVVVCAVLLPLYRARSTDLGLAAALAAVTLLVAVGVELRQDRFYAEINPLALTYMDRQRREWGIVP